MTHSWYVVRTKPRCEYRAAAALEREGFELFLPLIQMPRTRGGYSTAPLFPGYIFLRHDRERQRWPSVRQLPGIFGWLRLGGVVPSVPERVITELAQRAEAINSTGGLWTRFRRGQRVRVVSDKMDSLAQVLEEPASPQARVRVLLQFMGRLVSAQVPWSNLQPLPGAEHVYEAQDVDNAEGMRRRTRGGGRWIRGFGPRAPAVV